MTVVSEMDFPTIVEIYNTEGKPSAYAYIRETYGVKNPYFVMARIRKDGRFKLDAERDRFIVCERLPEENLFMSIEDLCSVSDKVTKKEDVGMIPVKPSISMDELIRDLISDRLLELSRYVKLERTSRTILIDRSSMIADGYNVVTQ